MSDSDLNDHQVIIGALNAGENAFSLGGLDGANFVACAIGGDVVVLTSSLERIQILLGNTRDAITSINSCRDSGKIAACYKNIVRIFEPSLQGSSCVCQYRWTDVQTIQCPQIVDNVQWSLRGLRLLVISGDDLLLYQHKHLSTVVSDRSDVPDGQHSVKFALAEEDILWENVWSCKLSARVKYAKFSPDGTLFATCGEKDKLIKIWYQLKDSLSFSFIYLQHPAPVCGFEWRLCGRYMKYVQNALISWCEDNTSRIWKEIPSRDSAYELIIDAAELAVSSGVASAGSRKISTVERSLYRHTHLRRAKKRLANKLSHIMKKKKTARTLLSFSNPNTNISRNLTIADFSMPAVTNSLVFALAGTINAENDCYLVPSMKPQTKKPFTVHWLNNKEIFFTYANEKILSDTILIEQRSSGSKTNTFATSTSTADIVESNERSIKEHYGVAASTPVLHRHDVDSPSSQVSDISTRDLLDYKLEEFLREWNKSFDILFSVHPVDGSLLTWSVEWLDDLWKQANISFSSRFPDAFPLTDASSLYPTLCVFNARESTLMRLQRRHNNCNEQIEDSIVDVSAYPSVISMLTNHENGSLNLWHLKMDESSHFSTVLSVSHRSRMCGHRFHISNVVPHPTLPLLLTTSQFQQPALSISESVLSESPSESELILWSTVPIAPLCRSGGLRELSRITQFFSSIAWIPIIIPSFAMGAECNSPSACFVAGNDGRLSIFQAVVDARGILSYCHRENTDGVQLINFNEHGVPKSPYDVISSQSSSRPGCIIHVGDIPDSDHLTTSVIFLHVFVEDSTVMNKKETSDTQSNENCIFLDRYIIVMVLRTASEDRLRMWSLTIRTETINIAKPPANDKVLLTEAESQNTSAKKNVQIVKLLTEITKVYDKSLNFDDGSRIVTCVPAADHLSSASLYPSCKTPYTFVAAFSDGKIRFLLCTVTHDDNEKKYSLNSWKMVNQTNDSSLCIEGKICDISSAYSGRFACIYKSVDTCIPEVTSTTMSRDSYGKYVMSEIRDMELSVFECESSGGVEWVCEDVLSLKQILDSAVIENNFDDCDEELARSQALAPGRLVRINWVSTEDGAHILTVGIGHVILFFVQTSQTSIQRTAAKLKLSPKRSPIKSPRLQKPSMVGVEHKSNRLVRWICIRTIRLLSADNMPPFPTAISWVRDGLLIVGMNSEMRVYNQWILPIKSTASALANAKRSAERSHGRYLELKHKVKDEIISISRSHSRLDQIDRTMAARVASSRVLKTNAMSSPHSENATKEIDGEGIFEACRLSNPMLPQYHPKQLIELLNAGKTKRVKAILLHVLKTLKHRQILLPNPLSRAASLRRMHIANSVDAAVRDGDESADLSSLRRPLADETSPDYNEIDIISPLPLYSLIAADNAPSYSSTAGNEGQVIGQNYDSLFNDVESDEDLDEVLDGIQNDDGASQHTVRTRNSSGGSERFLINTVAAASHFTTRHSRLLTEQLTHTHLPGLSSVDQMHMLAIADTISHFSPNVMDKLMHVNAAFQPAVSSTLGDSTATGYANATMGTETVDECGLRFLMAMKQHEYLILCLPFAQRKLLKARGISMAHIIWAFHSVTETELLSAIPCCQKSQEMWEELRAYGVAWWVKNTSTLRICVEKMAKCAFQQNQDPMDASLFYLALRKKNVLMHLFKTVNNGRMFDFFRENFNEDKWKRAALKNAFALMSKQRYHHAAAFFLLGGSLKDAVQTIVARLKDIQLAMVVIRLYEVDIDVQCRLLTELLCNEVLGCSKKQLRSLSEDEISSFRKSSKNPFERSMACWLIKEYAMSASTLVEEASRDHLIDEPASLLDYSLADIFNFYSYIRRHPLVLRQRLTNIGENIMSTDKFLTFAKELERQITPSERRLYFRTAFAHISSGCPLLALDVLARLPKQIEMTDHDQNFLTTQNVVNESIVVETANQANNMDWSSLVADSAAEDQLEKSSEPKTSESHSSTSSQSSIDFIAQHLKFVAILRIMLDELSTLASGTEISGGQLRNELFNWLTKECQTLHDICDFRCMPSVVDKLDFNKLDSSDVEFPKIELATVSAEIPPLHESLHIDRMHWRQQTGQAIRRRRWLRAHQKLLRIMVAYCALHSAQNYRLTSIQMELLLLLLEVQNGSNASSVFTSEPVAGNQSFPLLLSALNNCRMFVLSPLQFIRHQSDDILLTVAELHQPPSVDYNFSKIFTIYNLCQGLSSCLYQALTDLSCKNYSNSQFAQCGELIVQSPASKWPGVESLIALLSRKKDEETPPLRLLIVEFFAAIFMSLFGYALAINDARWLFRLSAHELDERAFAEMFGGCCRRQLRSVVPTRPPPPNVDEVDGPSDSNSAAIRAKLHAKVFGADMTRVLPSKTPTNTSSTATSEQTISCWVPPKKHVVQFFAEKVSEKDQVVASDLYDSEADEHDESSDDDNDHDGDVDANGNDVYGNPVARIQAYAWLILRLASVNHLSYQIRKFVVLAGFEVQEIATASTHLDSTIQVLNEWSSRIKLELESFDGGRPDNILRNFSVNSTPTIVQQTPLLHKYSTLLEPNNTPFEANTRAARCTRRLWNYLIRKEHLSPYFIKHIFGETRTEELETGTAVGTAAGESPSNGHNPELPINVISEAIKITQRENEPIMAFACNTVRPGNIVLSTGRELQEISIERILENREFLHENGDDTLDSNVMLNRVQLDIAMQSLQRNTLRDNDDYQLIKPSIGDYHPHLHHNYRRPYDGVSAASDATSTKLTPFIIDRSRVVLQKLCKRPLSGIRKLESHSMLPYYLSGSTDGSILLWEWGVDQPLFTARVAGQYAKVTKLAFAQNSNKFAAVDGDGLLCIWQSSQYCSTRRPFFSHRCHTKTAADVKFLGQTSSLLVTAGHGTGDQNVILWDTLLPQNKAVVHSFVGQHQEGATCVAYLSNSQSILSGGRYGELCLWDLRQCQLRTCFKAFDNGAVRCMCVDPNSDIFVVGSSEGDIKIWSADVQPQLLHKLSCEHVARSGFTLRKLGASSSVQGVQQVFVDVHHRLFSCGADSSLKIRNLSPHLSSF